MPMPGLIGTGFVISRRGVSLLAVLLFLSMIGIMGWWVAGRGVGSGEADVASTAEYVEESRQLSPDDRPKWVRVARGCPPGGECSGDYRPG